MAIEALGYMIAGNVQATNMLNQTGGNSTTHPTVLKYMYTWLEFIDLPSLFLVIPDHCSKTLHAQGCPSLCNHLSNSFQSNFKSLEISAFLGVSKCTEARAQSGHKLCTTMLVANQCCCKRYFLSSWGVGLAFKALNHK